MKVTITKEAEDEQRAVYFDNSPVVDFYIKESELQELIKLSRHEDWAIDQARGIEFGSQLFNLLNRNNGKLQQALDLLTNSDQLDLFLDVPQDLNNIPFELLYYNEFIILKSNVDIIRMVSEKGEQIKVRDRALRILFVVTSPAEHEYSILSFEQEEDLILEATKKYPVEFQVEDTGSLEGIENMLYELGDVDILHISGHAGHDINFGPIFHMEDEVGNEDKVTPTELYRSIKDNCPSVLFLSGCSTGKGDHFTDTESFAFQMSLLGVPIVLSWGLPVSDSGATRFASEFYGKVAKGQSISYSVNEAQLSFKDHYYPWPLMRLFSSGALPGSLVTKGSKIVKSSRTIIHKQFENSEVQILEKGFIGRRRELQKAHAVLKNINEYENKYGLIIRGPAGVGKSCFAGRILERQTAYNVLVLRGKLTIEFILYTLTQYFDKNGIKAAIEILKRDEDYEEKVKDLYREVFSKNRVILYFDDFDQNLRSEKGIWYMENRYLGAFKPFLEFIDYAQNVSKIVITSRYPFDLQAGGKNLCKKYLEDISLVSFTGPDENKMLRQLLNISKSKHFAMYKEFGHGNPRLMNWLETMAADESNYNINEIKEKLEGKNEEYVRTYLVEIIAGSEGEEFNTFLNKSAVYGLPVEASAFEAFGEKKWLEKGVDLTLLERESKMGCEKRYWVMPVIRKQIFSRLTKEEQQESHRTALAWYSSYLKDTSYIPYHQEALFHAILSKNMDKAAKHIVPIGEQLSKALEYGKQQSLYAGIIDKIDAKSIETAKQDRSQSISSLFNEYGLVLTTLADSKKAVTYFQQAIDIALAVYGDNNTNIAEYFNNLGYALKDLGDSKNAIRYYNKALEIYLNVNDGKNPEVAAVYNNLGSAILDLGDSKTAIDHYKKSLEIYLSLYGNKDIKVAPVYNNLGTAYQDLKEFSKAFKYLNQALEIDLAENGDKHPNIAMRYNNLSLAYQNSGNLLKAIEYSNKALKIGKAVFGESHSVIAAYYNNLGRAYQKSKDPKKAIRYYNKALKIVLTIYNDKHPKAAHVYNNLGWVNLELENSNKAVEYFNQALEIYLSVYHITHPKVSQVYNGLATAHKAKGDEKKEMEYLNKISEINSKK